MRFHAALAELQQSALLTQLGIAIEAPAAVTATQVMSVATEAAAAVSTIGKHIQANPNGKNEQCKPLNSSASFMLACTMPSSAANIQLWFC